MWAIASKQDNVWIKWVNSVYLKGARWWDYRPPVGASWYWKKICHVKEELEVLYTENEFCKMNVYSIHAIYDRIRGKKENVAWDKAIWNILTLPKYRFIMWLAIQGKLQTTTKLAI